MTYTYFGEFLEVAERVGFFDYVLPFMLYFAIIFGLLERVDLFGKGEDISGDKNRPVKSKEKDSRKINLIISMSMAFLIMYYYPPSRTLGNVLAELLTQWGAFVLFLMLIPVAMAAFGVPIWDLFYTYERDKNGNLLDKKTLSGLGWAILVLIFLVLLVLFYNTIGRVFDVFWVFVNPQYLGVFLVIVFLITLIILIGSTD